MNHRDIINALERQARDLEAQAATLALDDYSREFPMTDAELLREAAQLLAMRWRSELPTLPGFYYWHGSSGRGVRLVHVSRYKSREAFHAQMLHDGSDDWAWSGELINAPPGQWAGPLPQPQEQPK